MGFLNVGRRWAQQLSTFDYLLGRQAIIIAAAMVRVMILRNTKGLSPHSAACPLDERKGQAPRGC
jgi:hypothetical protein